MRREPALTVRGSVVVGAVVELEERLVEALGAQRIAQLRSDLETVCLVAGAAQIPPSPHEA